MSTITNYRHTAHLWGFTLTSRGFFFQNFFYSNDITLINILVGDKQLLVLINKEVRFLDFSDSYKISNPLSAGHCSLFSVKTNINCFSKGGIDVKLHRQKFVFFPFLNLHVIREMKPLGNNYKEFH